MQSQPAPMTTSDLYHRMTAGTLARIYLELSASNEPEDVRETVKVQLAGIGNCGETEFNALVAELEMAN